MWPLFMFAVCIGFGRPFSYQVVILTRLEPGGFDGHGSSFSHFSRVPIPAHVCKVQLP